MSNLPLHLLVKSIKQKRVALNYSQEYMAAKLSVGQNCYSKIELGYSKLTVERLLRICELLEINPGSLFLELSNN